MKVLLACSIEGGYRVRTSRVQQNMKEATQVYQEVMAVPHKCADLPAPFPLVTICYSGDGGVARDGRGFLSRQQHFHWPQ